MELDVKRFVGAFCTAKRLHHTFARHRAVELPGDPGRLVEAVRSQRVEVAVVVRRDSCAAGSGGGGPGSRCPSHGCRSPGRGSAPNCSKTHRVRPADAPGYSSSLSHRLRCRCRDTGPTTRGRRSCTDGPPAQRHNRSAKEGTARRSLSRSIRRPPDAHVSISRLRMAANQLVPVGQQPGHVLDFGDALAIRAVVGARQSPSGSMLKSCR